MSLILESEGLFVSNITFEELYEKFWLDGYVSLGKLFDDEEVEIIKSAINKDEEMQAQRAHAQQKYEAGGHPSFETIFVMNDVFTDNIYALACRKARILDFISYVFKDDAYLYHSKVPLKYPAMPGFKYHQDYYYWYQMGCIFPHMATCFIALDEATAENGCLKFIPKSHLCGRMDHVLHDGFSDSEADPVRVANLKNRFGEAEIKLRPGEVTIHHSCLLHGSGDNHSSHARLALLGCFNTENNSPINKDWDHPYYKKQERFYGKISEEHLNSVPDLSISFK